jgi:hypothetical protein
LLKQKVAQKVEIILGYFILSKNHNEPPKVAQLAKKLPNLVTLQMIYSTIISYQYIYFHETFSTLPQTFRACSSTLDTLSDIRIKAFTLLF